MTTSIDDLKRRAEALGVFDDAGAIFTEHAYPLIEQAIELAEAAARAAVGRTKASARVCLRCEGKGGVVRYVMGDKETPMLHLCEDCHGAGILFAEVKP